MIRSVQCELNRHTSRAIRSQRSNRASGGSAPPVVRNHIAPVPKGSQMRIPLLATHPRTLIAPVILASLLGGCGGLDSAASKQAVARVNEKELSVHQINHVAQRLPGNLSVEQIAQARLSILNGLVEQETLVQYAAQNKIDRDAQVVQQLESARRDILARAAIERIGSQGAKPTPEELRAFYDANPELFKKRRVYRFDEIVLPGTPTEWPDIQKRLMSARSIREADTILRTRGIEVPIVQGVSRTTESLPMAALPEFLKRRPGELVIWSQPPRVVIGQLTDLKESPVDADKAIPLIEQFLTARKRQEMISAEVKRLNETAKVTYLGEFAANTVNQTPTRNAPGATAPDAGSRSAAALK